mmetsp:Transcript_58732/g.138049  ORF Transcript_58732/g.138049 Transcript_58732/m.138049 type:complete len:204 (-) Transcript_58732:29-640(-)
MPTRLRRGGQWCSHARARDRKVQETWRAQGGPLERAGRVRRQAVPARGNEARRFVLRGLHHAVGRTGRALLGGVQQHGSRRSHHSALPRGTRAHRHDDRAVDDERRAQVHGRRGHHVAADCAARQRHRAAAAVPGVDGDATARGLLPVLAGPHREVGLRFLHPRSPTRARVRVQSALSMAREPSARSDQEPTSATKDICDESL